MPFLITALTRSTIKKDYEKKQQTTKYAKTKFSRQKPNIYF